MIARRLKIFDETSYDFVRKSILPKRKQERKQAGGQLAST